MIGVVNSQMNDLTVAQVTGSIPQNVNFAIKASTAMVFLETNSIAFETSSDFTAKPLTDIADAAKRFSVLITCQSDSSENSRPTDASVQVSKPERSTSNAGEIDQRVAASILDAMRRKIESCWRIPAGAREAKRLLIKIEITLNQDGTLAASPILLNRSSHPAFEAASRAAQAAVEACAPYDFLPADKYAMWHDMILNFDPSQMLQSN
jgi:hypothetical protein